MATLNLANLSSCNLSSLVVYKSTISKSTLRNVAFHNCTLTDSTFYNCQVYNSNVRNSKLFHSQVYGNIFLKCEFVGTSIMPAKLGLEKLPVEVREMIFKLCLHWDGKIPGLIVALRGHKELYEEAMTIFRLMNVLTLKSGDSVRFFGMPDSALSKVHAVKIEGMSNNVLKMIPESLNPVILDLSFTKFSSAQDEYFFKSVFAKFKALQKFKLTFQYNQNKILALTGWLRSVELVLKGLQVSAEDETEEVEVEGRRLIERSRVWTATLGQILVWDA